MTPVLSVLVADDLEHALKLANQTHYGLTAGFHSLDEAEVRAFCAEMNSGNLYVNRTTTGAIVAAQLPQLAASVAEVGRAQQGGRFLSSHPKKARGGLFTVPFLAGETSFDVLDSF